MSENVYGKRSYRFCSQCNYAIPNNISIFCGNCGYQFADRRNITDTQMILGSLDRVRCAIGDINHRQSQFVEGLNSIGDIVKDMGARVSRLEILAERKQALHSNSLYTKTIHHSIDQIQESESTTLSSTKIDEDTTVFPVILPKSASVPPPPPTKPKPAGTKSFEIDDRAKSNSDVSDSDIEDISESNPLEDINSGFCETPTVSYYNRHFEEK